MRIKWLPNVLILGTLLVALAAFILLQVSDIVGRLADTELGEFLAGGAFALLITVVVIIVQSLSQIMQNLTSDGPPPVVPATTHEKLLDKVPDLVDKK